jgi:phosphatidate cytidylyltransferase
MLKQRLLTALILIPLVVWLLSLSTPIVAGVIGFVVVLGAWEWAGLCGWQGRMMRGIYALVMALVLLMLYWFQLTQLTMTSSILLVACLWWLLALFWVLRYQAGDNLLPNSALIKAVLGFLILVPAWTALLILHKDYGWHSVIFLFVLIWTADSGAYFAGKAWGKRKLADKVSPGKSWEGVLGALVMSAIFSICYAVIQSIPLLTLLFFVLLCLLTVMVSILGDLLESLFKRQMGIKDSGQILPGHGGILDRIDSLTSAAPVFVTSLILLGISF